MHNNLYNKGLKGGILMDGLSLWQIWSIAGVFLCIVEIFTPAMFFLNLGLACFVSALASFAGASLTVQVVVFAAFSAVFLIWLRPYLLKQKNSGNPETVGLYIGKTAKVLEKVSSLGGRISIFDEEWQAKSVNEDDEFNPGEKVRIVKNDSIVMYVEKL